MPETSEARGTTVTARAVMPWKAKNEWDAKAIADYHAFAQSWLRSKVDAGFVRDCADAAITLLIDYAESASLPVAFNKTVFDPKVITNHVGRIYYPKEGYTREAKKPFRILKNKTKLDSTIRMFWSAAMLAKEGSTKSVSHNDAKPGDICLIDWPDSSAWHTILVGERDDAELPVWMVMGNLDGSDNPTPLELVTRESDASRVERYFKNPDLYQGKPRRWHFDFFNESV